MRITRKRIAALFPAAPMPAFLHEASPKLQGEYRALRIELRLLHAEGQRSNIGAAVQVSCRMLADLLSKPSLCARRPDLIEHFSLRLNIMQRAIVRREARQGVDLGKSSRFCATRLRELRAAGTDRSAVLFRETRLAALCFVRREARRKAERRKVFTSSVRVKR